MSDSPIHFVELMGIPASGKSTLAATFEGYTLIDTDAIRYEIGALASEGRDAEGNEETCQRAYAALMRCENVVLDAPSVAATRVAMLGLVELAEQNLGRVIYRELMVLRMPLKLCIERNLKRPKPYPEEQFTRHYVHFEKGLTEIGLEGWDAISFLYAKDS